MEKEIAVQLRAWNHIGYSKPNSAKQICRVMPGSHRETPPREASRTARVSYLDANCASVIGGRTVAVFDARYDTPLCQTDLIGATGC